MSRIYTIWPSDREGVPATTSTAWRQNRHWLVLDVTDGLDRSHVVEGPVTLEVAVRRELELRAIAKTTDTREEAR